MRASRLLHILLLLQNRGLMTAPRTIQRDIDALTEAGLPVITHRGAQGGVELGFNYRTRLTGLAADEPARLHCGFPTCRQRWLRWGLAGRPDGCGRSFRKACPIPAAPSRRPPPQGFRWTTA